MRLTNFIRDAFIRSAMADVPKAGNFEEEAHKLVIADSIEQLPPQLRPVALDKNLSRFLSIRSCWFHDAPFGTVSVFAERGGDYRMPQAIQKKVDDLAAKARADRKTRDELESRLRAAAYGCTTRKALVDLLPEFEKYLPPEEDKGGSRSLPVVANLVADFSKAGWPKGQKQQTKVAA